MELSAAAAVASASAEAQDTALTEDALFGPEYLVARPLLRALQHPGPRPAVLLIDEIDRADDDFEAFLLELLAEAAVTIPELGTIKRHAPPAIVLTSNRTRDLHDAVKRRCLYQWIDYPDAQREVEIVRRRVKGASESLAVQVVAAVAKMRDGDIQKPPGIAEAIDWLKALELLGAAELEPAVDRPHAGQRPEVRRGPGRRPRRGPGEPGVRLETVELDLRAAGRRLRTPPARGGRAGDRGALGAAGERVDADAAGLAHAAVLDGARGDGVRRGAGEGVRSGLLLGVRVARGQADAEDERRDAARGDDAPGAATAPGGGEPAGDRRRAGARRAASARGRADARGGSARDTDGDDAAEVLVPVAASDEERLREKRFDALEPGELAQLYVLMTRIRLATPTADHAPGRARPARRAHRPAPDAAGRAAHRRRPGLARAPAPPRRPAAARPAV